MRRLIAALLVISSCSLPGAGTTTTEPKPAAPATTTTTLGAAEVYRAVSSAVALVETPVGTGSAVLVDPTTLVTNAHVVWPAERVSVSFPNGPSGSADVIGYDWMADLALLDVSGLTELPAAVTIDTGPLGPGSAVYLVGYPADGGGSVAPAITAGIVSRTRTWEQAGLTFIQSDALISGGQSGGALVDGRGHVVGISGLSVGDGFALALTAPDLTERMTSIQAGDGRDGLLGRTVADLAGPVDGEGTIPHHLDEVVFVFDAEAGDSVAIEVRASSPVNADLVGPDGFVEATSDAPDVRLTLEADLVLDGPYFVAVFPELAPVEAVAVSGAELRTWLDPDHGRPLSIGLPLVGNGDYPGDLDWFRLDLEAGQTVTITASSINIDAALLIDLLEPGNGSVFVTDSDSRGGVIGFDSELVFTAPETASYAVAVFDETGFGPGGYVLEVEEGTR